MKSWIVYEHISPSGKVYIGITCQKPEKRWKRGAGYVRTDNHQPLFANAILKYGWDNIEHKIVATGLTKKEAAEVLGIKNKCNISASIEQRQCLVNGYVFLQWDKDIPIKEDCIYRWYDLRVNNRYDSERKVKHGL